MVTVIAASFILKIGLLFYLCYHSPSNPKPVTGEICQLRCNGYIFYVTRLQSVLQDALFYIFGVLMCFIVVLRIYWEVSSPKKDTGKSKCVN
jgi:hypothetical protein